MGERKTTTTTVAKKKERENVIMETRKMMKVMKTEVKMKMPGKSGLKC